MNHVEECPRCNPEQIPGGPAHAAKECPLAKTPPPQEESVVLEGELWKFVSFATLKKTGFDGTQPVRITISPLKEEK